MRRKKAKQMKCKRELWQRFASLPVVMQDMMWWWVMILSQRLGDRRAFIYIYKYILYI
jgi:hypothetical protein